MLTGYFLAHSISSALKLHVKDGCSYHDVIYSFVESFRSTGFGFLFQPDLMCKHGSDLDLKDTTYAHMVAASQSQGSHAINHTLLYHLFFSKWDQNLQNEITTSCCSEGHLKVVIETINSLGPLLLR